MGILCPKNMLYPMPQPKHVTTCLVPCHKACSAVPSSHGDFRASVQWITMPSVLQMTNTPFTHLSNPLPARRRSTLMHLCPFTLILHAPIVENASLPPLKKTPHTIRKYTSLRVIPCPDPSCKEALRR